MQCDRRVCPSLPSWTNERQLVHALLRVVADIESAPVVGNAEAAERAASRRREDLLRLSIGREDLDTALLGHDKASLKAHHVHGLCEAAGSVAALPDRPCGLAVDREAREAVI